MARVEAAYSGGMTEHLPSHVLPSTTDMYRALVERDTRADGVFVAAVKTTGIFCLPSCGARKPRPENVEFFATAREALLHGYRPCRLCRPMAVPGAPPEWLRGLLEDLERDPGRRLRDEDLRSRGLEPQRVRRWFKAHHGMTFHAYQRLLRLGQAFGRLRQGADVAAAAFGSGHESLSGFADAFKKTVGLPPSQGRHRRLIRVTRVATPLGPILAGAVEEGICLLEFVDRRMLETQLDRLAHRLRAEILPGTSPHFRPLTSQLTEYFTGTRTTFDLPIVALGTPFQERVWAELRTIAYGTTRSYGEQARRMGQPTAVRAVARANGDNRIAILIPCHRVIGADGKLTGYGGGLWRKERLLDLERARLG